jgi:phosphoglycerol transferase MdoB-like AlkP superfamily enzyme
MKKYFSHIRALVYRLLILIIVFQITRLLFLLFNLSVFESSNFSDLLLAFLWGTRFDLWVIFWFNAIFILLNVIPGNYKDRRGFQSFLKYYFIIVNSILLLPNLIDIEYFKFTNKRSTADIFSFISTGDDTWVMLPQFLKDFWFIILIWIVLILLMWKLYNLIIIKTVVNELLKLKHIVIQLVIFVFIGCFMFMVLRGTNLRPVNLLSAARFVTNREIPLVLNTPFSIIRTWSKDNLVAKKYFDENVSSKYFSPFYEIKSENEISNQGKNVVIIILESFSKEYIGYFNNDCKGFTPFLDSLLGESMVFENSYANGKKSIESLPAILAGIPSLSETPYVLSKYSTNKIDGLPGILKKHGYSTSFYHGGTNGTMGFDVFSLMAGCDNYFGKNEYPDSKDYDGHWGIWDEPYFQYFSKQLEHKKEPFFSVVYSLSSHHPYKVPEKYKTKLPTGKYEIFQSIAYTDLALRKFFDEAKKSKWFANTVFLITADHTFWALDEFYNNRIGMYSVPIVMYSPSDSLLKGRNENIMQHSDVTPTILDYLSFNDTVICFGKSAFDNSQVHFSVNYISGNYQLIKDNYLLLFDGDKSVAMFNYKKDRMLNNNILDSVKTKSIEMERLIKSIIQNYNNRLISNKLTVK